MDGTVLILGADDRLRTSLELLIPNIHVKSARGAVDSEGQGIDVVVIAGEHPVSELTEVRVHPMLHATPVVLYAPGHRFADDDWHARGVWPITQHGLDALEEICNQVARLVTRAHHPSIRPRQPSFLRAAS